MSCIMSWSTKGLEPEIVPSTFDETLPQSSFEDIHEYPVATASQKAVEVYERLVVRPSAFSVFLIVNPNLSPRI